VYPTVIDQVSIPEKCSNNMTNPQLQNQPIKYIIRIKNQLDTRWERWFEGMTITQADDGSTILTGEVVDQSALYGILDKIHSLNLSLISFQKADSD
jgi:hypothetical protein